MANIIPVVYKGKRKLVSLSENFEELKRNVRARFSSDIPDGADIEIKAQDSNGAKYSVDDDEDFQKVRGRSEELHIRSLSERPESAVVVEGVNYRIDQIPSPDSPIVQAMKKEFNTNICNIDAVRLDTRLGKLCDVADLFQLAVTASNTRGANLHDLVEASDSIVTFLVKLSHDVDVYYASITSTCKSVVEVVMVVAGFHLDGLDDIAIKELAKLGKVSSRMASQCQKLVEKVDTGVMKVKVVQEQVAGEVKVQESNRDLLEQLPVQIEKKNIEISEKRANLEESRTGAKQRHTSYVKSRDSLTKAATGAGGLAAAVTTAVSVGIKTGALAMTMPVLGVPMAMLAATGTLLYACNKQTSDMNAQQVADEAMFAQRKREEAQSQKELLDLAHKLEQKKVIDIDHVMECLHQVNGQLKKLHFTLVTWKTFWEKLATIFFPREQETEERFVDYAEETSERLHAMISGAGFKQMLIKYLARWVAFQEHCKESQASIQANLGPLRQLMERNLTPAEARAKLPNTAHAIGEKLASDGQTYADAAITLPYKTCIPEAAQENL